MRYKTIALKKKKKPLLYYYGILSVEETEGTAPLGIVGVITYDEYLTF